MIDSIFPSPPFDIHSFCKKELQEILDNPKLEADVFKKVRHYINIIRNNPTTFARIKGLELIGDNIFSMKFRFEKNIRILFILNPDANNISLVSAFTEEDNNKQHSPTSYSRNLKNAKDRIKSL